MQFKYIFIHRTVGEQFTLDWHAKSQAAFIRMPILDLAIVIQMYALSHEDLDDELDTPTSVIYLDCGLS